MMMRSVLQFRITLEDVKPAIWRRIQISDLYTFWDFHVAIQDAMGWTNSHLHEFSIINPTTREMEYLGIPDDESHGTHLTLAGWNIKVKEYIQLEENQKFSYLYDFGDSWNHLIEFEGEHEKQSTKYPKCLAGQRACPPEGVGGVPGYDSFLSIIKDPRDKGCAELLQWVDGKFDSEKFDPKKVRFYNPKMRWHHVFAQNVE